MHLDDAIQVCQQPVALVEQVVGRAARALRLDDALVHLRNPGAELVDLGKAGI